MNALYCAPACKVRERNPILGALLLPLGLAFGFVVMSGVHELHFSSWTLRVTLLAAGICLTLTVFFGGLMHLSRTQVWFQMFRGLSAGSGLLFLLSLAAGVMLVTLGLA